MLINDRVKIGLANPAEATNHLNNGRPAGGNVAVHDGSIAWYNYDSTWYNAGDALPYETVAHFYNGSGGSRIHGNGKDKFQGANTSANYAGTFGPVIGY